MIMEKTATMEKVTVEKVALEEAVLQTSEAADETERKSGYSAKSWALLFSAIAIEIMGTTCLKLSDGFTNWPYALAFVVANVLCLSALTLALKELPLGLSYGIWGGVGTIGVAIVGALIWFDPFTPMMGLGILAILIGTVLVNMGTK